MKSKYYFFQLEVALKDPQYPYVYAFWNVSHVPTKKLIELFKIDLEKDPYLMEGYFLTKSIYKKNKAYFDSHFGILDLNIFEYTLRLYVQEGYSGIRKMYKKNIME